MANDRAHLMCRRPAWYRPLLEGAPDFVRMNAVFDGWEHANYLAACAVHVTDAAQYSAPMYAPIRRPW